MRAPLSSPLSSILSRLLAPPAERSIELPPHASLQLQVAAGTQLVCVVGDVRVQPPLVWIADTMLQTSQAIDEGGHCVLTDKGWTTLQAGRAGARLHLQAPESGLSQLLVFATSVRHALQAMWLRAASVRKQAARSAHIRAQHQ